MKHITLIILVSIVVSIIGCTKDATLQSKQYPYVNTKDVTDIDETGATFEAEILNTGQVKITDFGFIWGNENGEYEYSLYNTGSLDNFRIRISTDMVTGSTYTCRAYLRTGKNIILGNAVTFKSLGPESLVIKDFNPKFGFDGTIIKLSYKYLSQISANKQVFVNNIPAEIIFSNDDSIVFKTPKMIYFGETSISIQIGSKIARSIITYKILGPEIEVVSLLSGHSGDYVTIEGKNFIQNGENVEVFFNYYTDSRSAEIISFSETKIEFIVPTLGPLFNDISSQIRLVNGLKTTSYSKATFLLKKEWELKQATPFEGFAFYQAFTFNEKGYIFEMDSKQLYEYSPISDKWKIFPSILFPGDRSEGSLYIVINENLFKIGGYDYLSHPLNELWVFAFNDKKWNKKNDLPFKFNNAVYYNVNNQVYIVTDIGQVWKCDFVNEQYTKLKDCPFNFLYAFASSYVGNGKAFVVTYGHTWQYQEQDDKWVEKTTNPFFSAQIPAMGFALNNTGYVLQGGQTLYKYNIIKDKWILTSMYPGSNGYESHKTTFIIGDKVYFAPTSGYYNDFPFMYLYQE